MSKKWYPNCDPDGFRVIADSAYAIVMSKTNRFFCRVARRRVLSAWHFCEARLYLCFNDAKVQADKLRARGKDCMVVNLSVTRF